MKTRPGYSRLVAGVFLLITCSTVSAADVTVTQGTEPERWQSFEVELPASANRVWNTIATEAGMTAMGAPHAKVALEIDGSYEVWSPTGTRVLAYVPGEMLAGTGSAPEQFPAVRKGGTWFIYDLKPVSRNKTTLRMTLLGWQKGDEWDAAFKYFLAANEQWMQMIHAHLAAKAMDVSNTLDDSAFKLEFDKKINATPEQVWALMSTDSGMVQWLADFAEIKLKQDGHITAYGPNIESVVMPDMSKARLLAYRPHHMLAHQGWLGLAQPPTRADSKNFWSVWRLESVGDGQTRVRYTAVGIGEVGPWKKPLFRLRKQIGTVLKRLKTAAEGEPTNWSEMVK